MLTLHHLNNSRSFRILWLLEELDLDYKLVTYERTKAYLAPEQLKQVHPLGHTPVLEVDGRALAESGFIIEYLLRHYDTKQQFKPTDDNEAGWEMYTFWLHFAEATAMPFLVMRLVFSKVVQRSPIFIKPISKGIRKQVENGLINKNIVNNLNLMERHLQDNHWFAGEAFSAADVQMYIVVAASKARAGLDDVRYANLLNWMKRCEARPAFQRASDKGGMPQF